MPAPQSLTNDSLDSRRTKLADYLRKQGRSERRFEVGGRTVGTIAAVLLEFSKDAELYLAPNAFLTRQKDGWDADGKTLTPIFIEDKTAIGRNWKFRCYDLEKAKSLRRSEVKRQKENRSAERINIHYHARRSPTRKGKDRDQKLTPRRRPGENKGRPDIQLNRAAICDEFHENYGTVLDRLRAAKIEPKWLEINDGGKCPKQEFWWKGDIAPLFKIGESGSFTDEHLVRRVTQREVNRSLGFDGSEWQKRPQPQRKTKAAKREKRRPLFVVVGLREIDVTFEWVQHPRIGREVLTCTETDFKSLQAALIAERKLQKSKERELDGERYIRVERVASLLGVTIDYARGNYTKFDIKTIRRGKVRWWNKSDTEVEAQKRSTGRPDAYLFPVELVERAELNDLKTRWEKVAFWGMLKDGCDSGAIKYIDPDVPVLRKGRRRWSRLYHADDAIAYLTGGASTTTVTPKPGPAAAATAGDRRPCWDRDHLWLDWYEAQSEPTLKSPTAIIDRWNLMPENERKRIAPEDWQQIPRNRSGRSRVLMAIKKARTERGVSGVIPLENRGKR